MAEGFCVTDARWRRTEKKHQVDDKPKDIDDEIDRAQNKALRHVMRIANRQSIEESIMKGMSPEDRRRIEGMLDEKAVEYLKLSEFPGFAESSDDDTIESMPIRPDQTQSNQIKS